MTESSHDGDEVAVVAEDDKPKKVEPKTFKEMGIDERLCEVCESLNWKEPTKIQRESIPVALQGRDIIGIAKTGSGKTLAFVIPLLECLEKENWSKEDGLGALVITPTRELAYQIFEVLRSVGRYYQFSAALIIGGKDLAMERKRIDQVNIIICTPGRLQQHMEENPLFHADNLKMLIIDEADRILDMNFAESLNIILDFLPKDRQCLLFSATLTKSVKDLARLSLKDPVEIDVTSTTTSKATTPEQLRQKFTVINLEQKLSFLWSFIKRHKKSKILVFIATCKQTRFIHDLFCRMKPGISINSLHGGLHQLKRMDTYNKFSDVRHCVLLATDVAARGLDFPDVDWVVQLDCPDSAVTYIHRVGRTARLDKPGRSIMVLMPNERDYFLDRLEKRNIPVEEVITSEKHLFFIESTVQSHLTRDPNLKEEAKRAFKCYIKSLLNSHFKNCFDPKQLDLKAYATSLGLEIAPRVRVLERRKTQTNSTREPNFANEEDTSDNSDDEELLKPVKRPRMLPDEEDEANSSVNIEREILEKKGLSKAKLAKELKRKNIRVNKHIVFYQNQE